MNRSHAEAVGFPPTLVASRARPHVATIAVATIGVDRPRFPVDIDAGSDKLGAKVRSLPPDPVAMTEETAKVDQQLPARGMVPFVAWTEREAHGRRGGVQPLAARARTGA